jgi:hypothetical protein
VRAHPVFIPYPDHIGSILAKLCPKSNIFPGPSPYIYCTDHVLNLMAKKPYRDSSQDSKVLDDEYLIEKSSETMVKTAWALVKLYSKSTQKKDQLLSKQKLMDTYKKKKAVKMIVDVISTRW